VDLRAGFAADWEPKQAGSAVGAYSAGRAGFGADWEPKQAGSAAEAYSAGQACLQEV
jgi:hypothetical protein